MRFISPGHIGQFRNAIYDIKKLIEFDGFDSEGAPIYTLKPLPIVTAFGTEKIHGCLKFDTLITTREFGDVPIKEIVENEIECEILTRNLKTNKNEWNFVQDSWKSENDGKEWFKITLNDDSEITITGNQLIWCPDKNEYIPVKDLIEGDIVFKR